MTGLAGFTALTSVVLAASGVTLWEILGVLSNLVVPLVAALVTLILWLHRRLRKLEHASNEVSYSVFGNERDKLHQGVIDAVWELGEKIDDMKNSIANLARRIERLEDKEDDD